MTRLRKGGPGTMKLTIKEMTASLFLQGSMYTTFRGGRFRMTSVPVRSPFH